MDIKIIVATHKRYDMPEDPMYIPVHVGAEGKVDSDGKPLDLGFIKDNTGDNISTKNSNYCELTGLYFMWKNMSADYMGLMHYRRYLASSSLLGSKKDRILSREEMETLLNKYDVILPTPRNYFIETTYDQYAHAHHKEDLDITREILSEKYPSYVPSFDIVMTSTKGHRFNMFVMRKDIMDSYLEWLFDVLFELEGRLDISAYNENDARVFGFVSERLMDVWLQTNHIAYHDQPYVYIEKQNWIVKGGKFLIRKFKGSAKD